MKILFTGGAGFIGSNIVDEYIKSGHKVLVVDDLSSGKNNYINSNAEFINAKVENEEKIREIFNSFKPDIVNHHAAQISVRESVENPEIDARINIFGILNILKYSNLIGVKKVIFASSGGVVYGNADQIPTSEEYEPKKPLSPYGVTKLASEHYLNYYYNNFGLKYLALRYANVFGPRQNPHGEAGVVAIFCKRMLNQKQPIINGDGLQTRDYVFIKDVVSANKIALSNDFTGSLNIGTGVQTNVVSIYEYLKSLIGYKKDKLHKPEKKGEQKISCLNISKAEKVLGWKPLFSLKEGLELTVKYFKNEND